MPYGRGDYYDYITLEQDDQFVVCIADVSGKGIPAAILMSNFQAVLRTISRTADNPVSVVNELNYHLCKNANRKILLLSFGSLRLQKERPEVHQRRS